MKTVYAVIDEVVNSDENSIRVRVGTNDVWVSPAHCTIHEDGDVLILEMPAFIFANRNYLFPKLVNPPKAA
jgi:hypothetical protein